MKRNAQRWTILAVALSAQLVPLLAFGDSAVSPELSLSELDQSVLNFGAVLQGTNPNNKAVLTGMIFNDCKAGLTITQNVSSSAASFRVRDVGGQFRTCMAAHKANNHTCTAESCTRLSQLPNAMMDLARAGDVNVQLCHEDFNQDLNREQCEDFAQPLSHISAATIARRRIEAREAARQARIDAAWQKVRGCRRNSEELLIARSGRDLLESMGLLTAKERGRIDRELDAVELRFLKRRAENGPIDELETLREDLLAIADRRGEDGSCDDLAPIYHQVALRYAHLREANNSRNDAGTLNAGYSQASATIAEAQELSCMSREVKYTFAGYQRDMEIDRVTALAGLGTQGNMEYYTSLWSLSNRLRADYMNACGNYNMYQQSGQNNACMSAYNALGSIQRIQQRAGEADQLRAESLRALQQSAAQAQTPSPQFQNTQLQIPGVVGGFYGNTAANNTSSSPWRF